MAEFPTVTAAEAVIDADSLTPKGVVLAVSSREVWVQTLSAYHRDEAQRVAKWAAAVATRPLKKGGDLYEAVRADYEMMDAQEQVDYITSYAILTGELFGEADRKHTIPQPPNLDEKTEQESMELVAKYDEECKKVEEARVKYVDQLRKQKEKTLLALTDVARVDECMKVFAKQEFNSIYRSAVTNEILHRAVRLSGDHKVRAFTVAEFQEMDDEPKQILADKYAEVDNLRSEEIPT